MNLVAETPRGAAKVAQAAPIGAPRGDIFQSPGAGCDGVAPAPGLGNNADFPPVGLPSLPPPSTVKAWYLRSYARETLKKAGIERRMRWCGSKVSRGLDGVGLYARPDRAYGRVSGVCVCGQSLACPVCAPRIAAFRASEVSQAFIKATAAGYEARLVTFTIPHTKASTLGREIEAFGTAWDRYQKGWTADKIRKHSIGNHVGRECTWGKVNGWNYHQHQLRYDEPGTFLEDVARAQWLTALDTVGRRTRGADLHSFDCGVVGSEAGARYVAKLATSVEAQARAIGSEIASAATKGRNLASLLLSASNGDDEARDVWIKGVSYITAHKISSVRWSPKLRAKLGISSEKSDAQVAEEEKVSTDEFLGALNHYQWRAVLNHRAEFALCCAANQGLDQVNRLLTGLDVGLLNDEDPRLLWSQSNKEGF